MMMHGAVETITKKERRVPLAELLLLLCLFLHAPVGFPCVHKLMGNEPQRGKGAIEPNGISCRVERASEFERASR